MNIRKDILVNSSIEGEIVSLPGAVSGTPVSGSLAIPKKEKKKRNRYKITARIASVSFFLALTVLNLTSFYPLR